MSRNSKIFCFLIIMAAALGGCSSEPANEAKKAATPLDKIVGKAQVLKEDGGSSEAALNAGGSSVYLWEGTRRYRLFLRTPADVVHGNQYVAEGVYAQKAIDEIGDPDQGKNGYPLQSSCERVVKMAWSNLSMDDPSASSLRSRVKRYPARPVFLVKTLRPATDAEIAAAKEQNKDATADDKLPEIAVPADKQKAALIEGPVVQTAPLWEPAGATVKCKLIIGSNGKVSSLETGTQLCEAVPWAQFRYQPPVQGGKPVKVATEVEVRFDARK